MNWTQIWQIISSVSDEFCKDKRSGLYAYPGNDTLYIHCTNGGGVVGRCGKGTVFDPSRRVCVFDWQVRKSWKSGDEDLSLREFHEISSTILKTGALFTNID